VRGAQGTGDEDDDEGGVEAGGEEVMRAFALAVVLVAGCKDSSDVQRLPIGSPCTTSGQCGLGKFFCAVDHPGGYCKADCHQDSDCPSGSVCAGAGMVSPGACHKVCPNGPSDCRVAEGYICKNPPPDATAAYCDAPDNTDGGV
jgi:hypothetical protein